MQVKCDQYWPARGTETYGLIQVTLLDTVELATYTVRTFALHKVWLPLLVPAWLTVSGCWAGPWGLLTRGQVQYRNAATHCAGQGFAWD